MNINNPKIDFKSTVKCDDDTAVLKVNGGRFKTWSKMFVGLDKDTLNNQQGAIIRNDEIPGYSSAIKSDLWHYLFKIYGAPDGQSPGYIKFFPTMPDMTKVYSNDEWFSEFNITPEEINHIRELLVDKKDK
jgi:hypothetical protein